jgi:co-chaperonin GroES (HSP10)
MEGINPREGYCFIKPIHEQVSKIIFDPRPKQVTATMKGVVEAITNNLSVKLQFKVGDTVLFYPHNGTIIAGEDLLLAVGVFGNIVDSTNELMSIQFNGVCAVIGGLE